MTWSALEASLNARDKRPNFAIRAADMLEEVEVINEIQSVNNKRMSRKNQVLRRVHGRFAARIDSRESPSQLKPLFLISASDRFARITRISDSRE